MGENITFVVLVTIDTSKGIGPTCIYGEHEIREIIKCGATCRGYDYIIAYPAEDMALEKGTCVGVVATITKENKDG